MIRFVRSAQVSEEKGADFARMGKAVVEYTNSRWPEIKVQIFWQRFAVPTHAVFFTVDCKDLNTLDRFIAEIGSDEPWAKLAGGWMSSVIEGSDQIMVLQSV